mgnify:CR=1 FL=1|jgi:hypothetical protein
MEMWQKKTKNNKKISTKISYKTFKILNNKIIQERHKKP